MNFIKKIVLTGGPSSGKTSVIKELKRRGFRVLSESGRTILGVMGSPKSKKEMVKVQLLICCLQKILESYCEKKTFLDRSLIDIFAYSKHFFGSLPKCMSLPNYRYDKVFVLDRLPFVADGLRIESCDGEAKKMHNLVLAEYELHGYRPIVVPLFPSCTVQESIERRAVFILNCCNEKTKGDY